MRHPAEIPKASTLAALGVLLCLACVAPWPAYDIEPIPPAPGPDVSAYTLRWRTYDSTCTAVLISPTRVLTAAHCIPAAQPFVTVWSDTRQAGSVVASFRRFTRDDHDQALVQLSTPLVPPYAPLSYDLSRTAWIAGYGCRFTQSGAKVLETRSLRLQRDASYSGRACRGDSGAGIWTADGRLQGIAHHAGSGSVFADVPRVW